MSETINIADLVKPKFKPGDYVFRIERGERGNIQNIRPVRIAKVNYHVEIARHDGKEVRAEAIIYADAWNKPYFDHELVASLDDLPADDRLPRLG
ncbi:hypothetical protein BcepIL02_gp24 [Burkholderia phage BcepIL02]|uniref:Uncharacterized protein n=1 Tax=Burkholderia phage BcepIL02 TaxID=2886898 RepID=C5IHL6_9CAUD|nr:hypothetical protein BcepIL02_gp24 [Burkholderia phage BcepIL02]ACR15017.1 hypothetical protein BcepIL02_gp24 [Burkholderia phage BcepIL02]